MRMLIALFVFLFASPLALAQEPGGEFNFDQVEEATEQIVILWHRADSACRGYHADTTIMFMGCAERDVLTDALSSRGWCLPGPLVVSSWQPCEADAVPESRRAPCRIEIFGWPYVDGPCLVHDDVDRATGALRGRMLVSEDGQHFAYLDFIGGEELAMARWSGDPHRPTASVELGEFRKQGECWANDSHGRICVYAPTGDGQPETQGESGSGAAR